MPTVLLRDPNSGISSAESQRAQMLAELVQAGPDGVSEDRMRELGGGWWNERIGELQKTNCIGWDRVDGKVRYCLVASSVERAIDTAAADREARPLVDGSLNTELTLFAPPSEPHYREAA